MTESQFSNEALAFIDTITSSFAFISQEEFRETGIKTFYDGIKGLNDLYIEIYLDVINIEVI